MRSIFCTVSISLLCAAVGGAEDAPKEYRDLPRMSGWYRGQPVQFRVWNGMALVEGDMLLGPAEELLKAPESKPPDRAGLAIAGEKYRWPGGVIPYEVDPNLPNPERVTKAIEEWQARTPIRFQARAGEEDYVRVNRALSGCNSAVGRVGGRQTVNLSDQCSTGSTIHELGHSVGLFHTQARIDRNLHVRVRYENIEKDSWDQYDQSLLNGVDIGPYDYGSIMHYSPTGSTRNNRNSMDTVPPGIPVGQRDQLSPGDAQAVARMYGAPPREVTISTFPMGLVIVVDGEEHTAPKSFAWAPGETHTLRAYGGFVSASPNRRLSFARWSDGGEAEHTITVGNDTLYMANYAMELRLRAGAAPPDTGTVQVEPPSEDGFYPYGQVLRIRAEARDDFKFLSWTPGFGAATYLGANAQGNASNPVELVLRNENAFYVANFTKSPITTVTSNPTGALVTVDGTAGYTPRAFAYEPGSTHTVSIAEQQLVEGDTARLQFREWSNNQADRRQTITAGSEALTLTASLNKQYQLLRYMTYVRLTTAAAPVFANIVTTPLNDDRFYDAGSTVQFSAEGPENVPFSNWSGDLGSSNPAQQLVIGQQTAVSANFLSSPFFNSPALVNHASRQPGPAAPGALMTLYTPRIGPAEEVALSAGDDGKYPTSTNGVTVRFGDTPAEMVKLTENSVTFLAPDVGAASAVVLATRSPRGNYSRTVAAAKAAPGIYTVDPSGKGPAATEGPVARGQEFRVKVTGIGMDQPLSAEIGGAPAAVTNVEAGDLPGTRVLTIATPGDAPAGPAVDLAVFAAGVRSQFGVTIEVQ